MENQGNPPPPPPPPPEEQQVVSWPKVRRGKEHSDADREHFKNHVKPSISMVVNHLSKLAGKYNDNVEGQVQAFLEPRPKLVEVKGTHGIRWDAAAYLFFSSDEGSYHERLNLDNPYFSGDQGSSFWIFLVNFPICRYRDKLIKLNLTKDVPCVLPNERGERDPPGVGAVWVEQRIRLHEFPAFFDIVPNWREWIPRERLGEDGAWHFSLPRGKTRVLVGDLLNSRRDYHVFWFDQFTIDGNTGWYCFAVIAGKFWQFKAGLALVSPQDVEALGLENDDQGNGEVWTLQA